MTEKKMLDHVSPLDTNYLLPSNDKEEVKAERWVVTERNVSRNSWNAFLVISFIGLATVIAALTVIHITRSNTSEDLVTFRTSFPGSSGHLVEQEVITSKINNIIEYYIASSPTERVTIVDDFNRDIQVVKISKDGDEFCYVSELKKGAYVRPSDVVFAPQVKTDKGYVSQVFESDEKPIDDLTVLGDRGADLCLGLPVFWIRPMSETEAPISASNFTSPVAYTGSRSKRNIRNCHVSCCWYVCCCNVHHFTWERAEHFTCNHVCNKCTPKFKSVVKKMC